MNKILLPLLLILTFSCQKNKSKTYEVAGHQGIFESIIIDRYNVPNGIIDSMSLSGYIAENYDAKGNQIKSIYYSNDSLIMMQFVNQFENGNKVRVDWVNAKDSIVQYVKNTYNENNKLIRSETFNIEDEFQYGSIHRWRENGLVEEKGPIEEGKGFKPNAIYTYNEENDYVDLKEYDNKDSLYATVKWNYTKEDDYGNWTSRQMITNEVINRIEKRNIKYQDR